MSTVRKIKSGLTKADIAALAVFVGLGVFLLFSARYSTVLPDESYYYVLAKRFAAGDRILLHDWQMSQLEGLFLILPYRLFTGAAHSTEGILLFMRRLFIAVDLALYWYYYFKLRDRKCWAVLAAALLCGDQFAGVLALNYYNISVHVPAIVGLNLFAARKKLSGVKLVFLGVLFACAVLNEPGLAFLYAAFTALILIRFIGERKGKELFRNWSFVVEKRNWFFLSVGIAVSAAVFLVYLQATSGIGNVIGNLPQLFSDSEFRITWLGNSNGFDKLPNTVKYFGWFNVLAVPLLFAAVLLLRTKARENKKIKTALFLLAILLFISCSAVAQIRLRIRYAQDPGVYVYLPKYSASNILPVYSLSLILWLLTERRDRRLLAFWILAAAVSAAVDFFSDISLGFGGRIAYIPAVLCFGELFAELQVPAVPQDKHDERQRAERNRRKPARYIAAALACTALACCAAVISSEYNYTFFRVLYPAAPEIGNASDADGWLVRTEEIPNGPYKGLRHTRSYCRYYQQILNDLDAIQEKTQGTFFTASNLSFTYLYVDRPVGTYSAFFVDSDFPERVVRYWELFPEKKPEAIYVPYRDWYSGFGQMTSVIKNQLGGVLQTAEGGCIASLPA